jgi:hypothetical protein
MSANLNNAVGWLVKFTSQLLAELLACWFFL